MPSPEYSLSDTLERLYNNQLALDGIEYFEGQLLETIERVQSGK